MNTVDQRLPSHYTCPVGAFDDTLDCATLQDDCVEESSRRKQWRSLGGGSQHYVFERELANILGGNLRVRNERKPLGPLTLASDNYAD